MVSNTIESFGSIDVLVNNAGVTRTSGIMDLTEEDWHWIHNVNAKGTFFCLQETEERIQQSRMEILFMAFFSKLLIY